MLHKKKSNAHNAVAHALQWGFVDAWRARYLVQDMGYFEYSDIRHIHTQVDTALGGVDAGRAPDFYVRLYASRLYHGYDGHSLHPEMEAVLDVVKVEKARTLLTVRGAMDKPAGIHWPTLIERLQDSSVVSPTTALYLADKANREVIRQRFPKAGLPDGRFEAVMQPFTSSVSWDVLSMPPADRAAAARLGKAAARLVHA